MIIPNQLKKERFIRLRHNDVDKQKVAAEKAWPTKANYSYEDFPKDEPTYGVLCGNNNLMVIDCDNSKIQEQLLQNEKIRETFIVKSAGKGLYHFYFHVESDEDTLPVGFRADHNKSRVFDLQGAHTYVLGPLSTLLNGKGYEIINPREIASVGKTELFDILKNIMPNLEIINPKTKKREDSPTLDFDEVCVAIKEKIKPVDLLPQNIKTPPGILTNCPLGHSSESGKCFSHSDTLWHCFHCEESGNVIQLFQKMNTCTFKEAKRELAKMAGLNDNLKIKILEMYSEQKTKHIASELLADEIVKMNKITTIRNDKDTEMWVYRNGIYVPNARTYIHQFVRSILGPLYSMTFSNKVVAKIEADTYKHQDDFFINEDITKVPLINGILDIKTKTIEPFSDKYIFFNKLPLIFDPLIKPELTLKFIKDILKDNENMELIQELFGYLLFREYNIEKTFIFLGSGRNGKGKLLGLIERFVGYQNSLSLSLQEITKPNSYDTEKLFGKYVNLGGDIPKTKIEDTSKLKQFTGRDSTTCMRKFLSPIKFINFAKFLFACNELPNVNDDSEGYYDRWIRVDFPYKFVNDPKEEHERQIDVNILNTITSDKEMSGLLNWALTGLERLQKNQKFTETEDNKFTRSKWADVASSFSAFLTSEVEVDTSLNGFISINDLNRGYIEFCIEHNLQLEKLSERKDCLQKIGAMQSFKTLNYKKFRVYNYIKFKDPSKNYDLNNLSKEEDLEL